MYFSNCKQDQQKASTVTTPKKADHTSAMILQRGKFNAHLLKHSIMQVYSNASNLPLK